MALPVTIAVPTYNRDRVLMQTIEHLLLQDSKASEILVLDQSASHSTCTTDHLTALERAGAIRWMRLECPSITGAMNAALMAAKNEIVLFLDDDIVPEQGLVSAHAEAHRKTGAPAVAGRVIQPWEEESHRPVTGCFHFAQIKPAWPNEFMAGNVSILRSTALELGGFDENFVRAAYRFEAEFAHRLRAAGCKIYFEPKACIHHLKVKLGGTRTYGDHLTTWRPDHTVGKYYFAMVTKAPVAEFFKLPVRAIATRHHLRRPWWIPITLVSELLGLLWAVQLALGPRGYIANVAREIQ